MSYQIQLDTNKSALMLQLYKTVDLSETSEIKEALMLEPKSGIDKLIVDGGLIEYLDSSAVALLLFAKRVAADNNMECEFLPFSDEAFKVIDMAGLKSTLNAMKLEGADSTKSDSDETEDLDFNLDDLDVGDLMLDDRDTSQK
tara:strand:- start:35 stop:463 length:429 start_codon:yes stop_codon:yes gene_type:complete